MCIVQAHNDPCVHDTTMYMCMQATARCQGHAHLLKTVPLRAGKPCTTVLSLAAKGTPSSSDSGFPAFQRSLDASASCSVFFASTPALHPSLYCVYPERFNAATPYFKPDTIRMQLNVAFPIAVYI